MKIGVICPSEIALRRFLPALKKSDMFQYGGVSVASKEEWDFNSETFSDSELKKFVEIEQKKAIKFKDNFGGKIYSSYKSLITDPNIDAVYLPLPPALHYKWAKFALENNKHVFLEKPATTSLKESLELIKIAKEKNLAIHENYMFVFHNQLREIKQMLDDRIIGDIREIKISFGFPKREANDFRYNKKLGGGALLDCGGYTIKYASILLGDATKLAYANLMYLPNCEVDMYGNAIMINKDGLTAFVSFGMDNSYKCNLEVWGSKGSLVSERILTAPSEFCPTAKITIGNEYSEYHLSSDDTFLKSIDYFHKCIITHETKVQSFKNIEIQARYIDEYLRLVDSKGV